MVKFQVRGGSKFQKTTKEPSLARPANKKIKAPSLALRADKKIKAPLLALSSFYTTIGGASRCCVYL